MSLLQSIIIGIIQGITEFLPISCTGHMILFQEFVQEDLSKELLLQIFIQFGILISIAVVFSKDIFRMIKELILLLQDIFYNIFLFLSRTGLRDELSYRRIVNNRYRKMVLMIIVSAIPGLIIQVLHVRLFEMCESIWFIPGICMILNGIFLLLIERIDDEYRSLKNISFTSSFMIGICQGVALVPGLSKIGMALTVGIAAKYEKRFAYKFSILLLIPLTIENTVMKLLKFSEMKKIDSNVLNAENMINSILGMIVVAIIGYISIRIMQQIIKVKKLKGFAFYNMLIGIFSIILHLVVG